MTKWRLFVVLLVPSVAILHSCQHKPVVSSNRFADLAVASVEGDLAQLRYEVTLDEQPFTIVLRNEEASSAAIVLDDRGEPAAAALGSGRPEGPVAHVFTFGESPSSTAALDLLNRDSIRRLPVPTDADVDWKNAKQLLRLLPSGPSGDGPSSAETDTTVVLMDNGVGGGGRACGRDTVSAKCKDRAKRYTRCRATGGDCKEEKDEMELVCDMAQPDGPGGVAQ